MYTLFIILIKFILFFSLSSYQELFQQVYSGNIFISIGGLLITISAFLFQISTVFHKYKLYLYILLFISNFVSKYVIAIHEKCNINKFKLKPITNIVDTYQSINNYK